MIFILKLTNNMELIDTPNPNAKKIEADIQEDEVMKNLAPTRAVPRLVRISRSEAKGAKKQPSCPCPFAQCQ